MRMLLGCCLAVVFLVAMPGESSAQAGSVAHVFAVEVPPDQTGAFLEANARFRTVLRRHAPGSKLRILVPLVSANPGTMTVEVRYPSAEACASSPITDLWGR
jgi:hypothetical protein